MHSVLKFKKQKEQLPLEPQPNWNLSWWTSMLKQHVGYITRWQSHTLKPKVGSRTVIVSACVLFGILPPSVIPANPHNLCSCTLWHSSKGHTCPAGSDNTALMPLSGRKKLSVEVGPGVHPQWMPDLRVLGTQFLKCHHCQLSFTRRFSVLRQFEHSEVFLSSRTIFLNEITGWFQQTFIKHFLYVLEDELAPSLPSKGLFTLEGAECLLKK